MHNKILLSNQKFLTTMANHQIYPSDDITPVEKLQFEYLDRNYKYTHMTITGVVYFLLMSIATLSLLIEEMNMAIFIVVECTIFLAAIINISIIPKAYYHKGYAFRLYDISYKSGIIFPKVTTIPFSKVQQVSINRNPISRLFNLCSVEIVDGAQSLSDLKIPGLKEDTANKILNLITEKQRNSHD